MMYQEAANQAIRVMNRPTDEGSGEVNSNPMNPAKTPKGGRPIAARATSENNTAYCGIADAKPLMACGSTSSPYLVRMTCQATKGQIAGVAGAVGGMVLGGGMGGWAGRQAAGVATQFGFLKLSRGAETEADENGGEKRESADRAGRKRGVTCQYFSWARSRALARRTKNSFVLRS